MSDPILNLTDPTRFFPRLRKVVAAIVRPAYRQWKAGKQWAGHKTNNAIMAFCADNFTAEKAAFHYLRIQRRLKHFSVRLMGRFTMTAAHNPQNHMPGYYIWHGFRRRR